MKRVIAVLAIVTIAAVAAGYFFLDAGADENVLRLSGNIELTQINIAFKTAGLVSEMLVGEGQNVNKDDVVARLDRDQLMHARERESAAESVALAALAQAQTATEWQRAASAADLEARSAELAAAEARLRELEAGSRPEEIEEARAANAAALAERDNAEKDWLRAQQLFSQGDISSQQHDQARARFESGAAAVRQTEQRLALVQAGPRAEVVETQREQVRRARALVAASAASEFEVRRREQEIAARRAELDRIRAQVGVVDSQLDETVVVSPISGVVLVKTAEAGEVVAPGATVAVIGDIDRPWLRGYVSESQLGRVSIGQTVRVTTDSFPGKVYNGTITFISSEAEFTPRQIQTAEERVKLVYRVKIEVENPGRELKLNMPADAEIVLNP